MEEMRLIREESDLAAFELQRFIFQVKAVECIPCHSGQIRLKVKVEVAWKLSNFQ